SITVTPAEDRGSKGKKPAATMSIVGQSTSSSAPLNNLERELAQEPTYKVGPYEMKGIRSFGGEDSFIKEFKTKIDVEKRLPDQYSRTFKADPPPKRRPAARGPGGPGPVVADDKGQDKGQDKDDKADKADKVEKDDMG